MSKRTPSEKSDAQDTLDRQNLRQRMRNPGPRPFKGMDMASIHAEVEAEEKANASPIPVVWPAGD